MSKIPQTNLKGKWQSSPTYITDKRSVSVYQYKHLQTNKKMTKHSNRKMIWNKKRQFSKEEI